MHLNFKYCSWASYWVQVHPACAASMSPTFPATFRVNVITAACDIYKVVMIALCVSCKHCLHPGFFNWTLSYASLWQFWSCSIYRRDPVNENLIRNNPGVDLWRIQTRVWDRNLLFDQQHNAVQNKLLGCMWVCSAWEGRLWKLPLHNFLWQHRPWAQPPAAVGP